MNDRLRIRPLHPPRDRPRYQARLRALEAQATYPIGDDFFQIDHGPDYFAFFDRMGRLIYYGALVGERLVAVGGAVLRRVPFRRGEGRRRTWYLCDLKVDPELRRTRIPLRMLAFGFPRYYPRCRRGYGISMNPGDGSENPMVRLLSHWRWSPIVPVARLGIYSLDAEAARAVTPLLRRERGPVSWWSPANVKDIVLQSTGAPMPLLHAEYGRPRPGCATAPREGHVHMVCCAEGDPLAAALAAEGLHPGADATVFAHRMESDWRFVVTSEI